MIAIVQSKTERQIKTLFKWNVLMIDDIHEFSFVQCETGFVK